MSSYPTDAPNVLNLDPTTLQALQEFAHRRRVLLTLRAIAAGIVVFIGAMLLVALLDFLFLLSDNVRWLLSLTGYAATFGVVWWLGVRRIKEHDPRMLARRIESAEPVLREDLLSAVELADPDDANGSPVFRARLQGRVARRVSGVNVTRLLPFGLIRRWLSTGSIVLIVCALCLFMPSLQFGRRLARAMLPGIAIERASRTMVAILEPSPASSYVAEGDAVAVIVEISGEPADLVTMHWRTANGVIGETEMTPRVIGRPDESLLSAEDESIASASESATYEIGEHFAANLSVGSEPVEYRITAGDAITLWYELTPLPRPRVKMFEKRYEFPSYAKLNDRVEEDEYGDLKALVGTMAHVTVQFDEPVQDAVIQFGNQGADIPMQQADESGAEFTVAIPIKTAGQYQVDATSVRSGLNNPFSPNYTITPVIDSPPVARWGATVQRMQLVSPLDVIDLTAAVRDDLPVDQVQQEFQINGGTVEIRRIDIGQPARELNPQWEWDLMRRGLNETPTAKLSPGDIVRTRTVAIDRRGNRGESKMIDLLIADEGFKADRHAHVQELAVISRSVIAWAESSRALSETIQATAQAPAGVDLAEINKALEELNNQTATVVETLSAGLELAKTVPEAGVIELVARAVLDIDRRQSLAVQVLNEVGSDNDESWRKTRDNALRELSNTARHSKAQADRAEQVIRGLVGQELSVGVLNDAISLRQSLRPMLAEENAIPESRFSRYLTVVKGRVETINQLIETFGDAMPGSTLAHFQSENWVRWAQRWAVQFEKAIENPPGAGNYRALVRSFDDQLGGKIDYSMNDGRLPGLLTNTTKDLRNEFGLLADWLRRAAQTGMAADGLRDKKTGENDSQVLAGLNRAEKFQRENVRRLHAAVLEKAASEESLHRRRPSVDLQYAADLGLLQRAVKNVTQDGFKPYREESAADVHNNLARAIQILEAHHEARIWQQELKELEAAERRIKDIGTAKLQHPMWLERYSVGLEWPARTLQNVGLKWELISPLDEARYNDDFNLARERITKRRWDKQQPLSAESVVAKMNHNLEKALNGLDSEVRSARDVIKRYVLTLPEQAREAAEKAEEAKQRTDEREDSTQETAEELAEQQEEAEQAAAETVKLLADKANTADTTDAEQRELARDADTAAAQIQEAVKQAQQEMTSAKTANDDQQRTEALEKAEDALENLAETLEKTAEHFEQAENGEDIAQSRQELREAEAAMQSEQLQQRFDQAEQMADAAQSDPRELLRQLEEELQRNELMQQELSEISEQAVDTAQRALKQAANDEKAVNQALERSDQSFQEQKRRAAKQLAELSQRANTVEGVILNATEQAVGWANDPQSRPKLQAARQALREAATNTNELGGENALLSDMQQAAAEMTEAVKKADEVIKDVQQQSAKNAEEDIHNDDGRRKQAQQSMKQQATTIRNRRVQAQNPLKQQWNQLQRDADNRMRQAQIQERNADKAKKIAENQLNKNPDNAQLQQQVQQQQQRIEAAKRSAEAAQQTRELAVQKQKQVDERTKQLRDQRLPTLEKPNPAAEFAQETARQAGEELDSIAEALKELGAQLNLDQQLQAPQSSAQQLADRQDQITEDVDNAAEQLARAARHEERLGKQPLSEMLEQAAESVEQNASQASEQAESSLTAAAEDAGKSPEANESVANATEQIGQEAERLANMLSAQAAAESQSPPNSESPAQAQTGPPNEQAQQQARQMAQTLDELDQALAQQQAGQSQSPAAGQPQASQQANAEGQPQNGQQGEQPGQPGQQQTAGEASPTLSSMVDAQNQQAARQRMQQMQANQPGQPANSQQPAQNPSGQVSGQPGQMPEGAELTDVFEPDGANADWGKLREQRTEDATESRSVRVAPEYRRELEAYFRAIAKQAAEKSE